MKKILTFEKKKIHNGSSVSFAALKSGSSLNYYRIRNPGEILPFRLGAWIRFANRQCFENFDSSILFELLKPNPWPTVYLPVNTHFWQRTNFMFQKMRRNLANFLNFFAEFLRVIFAANFGKKRLKMM